ncbi:MAG: hypothetical protein QNJ31_08310 [Candidatus Caenarcaniphilales bacterium]|nr:hypothetical protein [Candidatus Caenarcaniphilales bacterium]
MFKKSIFVFAILQLSIAVTSAFANNGFDSFNTFNPNDSYFHKRNRVPEYFRPRTMNSLIASLPEYSMFGPGYICDTRQAPPVYRLPLQYYRNVGYREADWFNNRLQDRHNHAMNFGGYDY